MQCPCKVDGVDCPKRWLNPDTLESCRTTCKEWQKYQEQCEEIRYKRHEYTANRHYDYQHSKKRTKWRK